MEFPQEGALRLNTLRCKHHETELGPMRRPVLNDIVGPTVELFPPEGRNKSSKDNRQCCAVEANKASRFEYLQVV